MLSLYKSRTVIVCMKFLHAYNALETVHANVFFTMNVLSKEEL